MTQQLLAAVEHILADLAVSGLSWLLRWGYSSGHSFGVGLGEGYGAQERKFRRRPEAKTALGRALVGAADALDRGADALGREDDGAVEE